MFIAIFWNAFKKNRSYIKPTFEVFYKEKKFQNINLRFQDPITLGPVSYLPPLHFLQINNNLPNLQQTLSQSGTAVANYSWLADGTKCGVVDNTTNGFDYLGSLIYSRSGSTRTLESTDFGGGRIVYSGGTYSPYYYITDHLGSVRVITNNSGAIVEQNDYYPFGGRHANGSGLLPTNHFKYNGKELQTTGFLDYGARMYDDVIGRWSVVDPLGEKYPDLSLYAYCANNPVIRIDPDGKKWLDINDNDIAQQLQQQIASRDKSLAKQEQKINAQIDKITNNKKLSSEKRDQQIAKQQEKLDDVQAQRTHLSNLDKGITQLGNSKTAYTFNTVETGTTATLSSMSDGTVVINNYGTTGNRAHETTHAIQYENGLIKFNPLGSNNTLMKNPNSLEIQAYATEYSITNGIVPFSDTIYPHSVFDITRQWLYGIKDPNTGIYIYRPENYK